MEKQRSASTVLHLVDVEPGLSVLSLRGRGRDVVLDGDMFLASFRTSPTPTQFQWAATRIHPICVSEDMGVSEDISVFVGCWRSEGFRAGVEMDVGESRG